MPVPISKPNFCYNRNFSIPVAVTMTLDWVSRTDTICWFSLSLSLPKSLECYKKGGLQEGKTGADLDCAAGQAVIGHSCPKRLPLGKKHHHWWGPRLMCQWPVGVIRCQQLHQAHPPPKGLACTQSGCLPSFESLFGEMFKKKSNLFTCQLWCCHCKTDAGASRRQALKEKKFS